MTEPDAPTPAVVPVTVKADVPITLIDPTLSFGRRGRPGEQGARGARGKGAFRQFAVIGVFIVITALALAYLVQQQQHYALAQCELRREAVVHQNRTWDELTAIEKIPVLNPGPASAKRIALRVKVYADAKVPVPDCEMK